MRLDQVKRLCNMRPRAQNRAASRLEAVSLLFYLLRLHSMVADLTKRVSDVDAVYTAHTRRSARRMQPYDSHCFTHAGIELVFFFCISS
jgi:hypothetical protein